MNKNILQSVSVSTDASSVACGVDLAHNVQNISIPMPSSVNGSCIAVKPLSAREKIVKRTNSHKSDDTHLAVSTDSCADGSAIIALSDAPVNRPGSLGRRRRMRSPLVRGSAKCSSLKAAEARLHFYLGGLAPGISTADVLDYLRSSSVIGVECVALPSKRPSDYSAFRVSVPAGSRDALLRPELWASGVSLRKYYFPRSPRITDKP